MVVTMLVRLFENVSQNVGLYCQPQSHSLSSGLWILDFGLGFWTWILDLDFGLGFGNGLGLDNIFKDMMNEGVGLKKVWILRT